MTATTAADWLAPQRASTTVRTAILNQRAALDALLAVLEMP